MSIAPDVSGFLSSFVVASAISVGVTAGFMILRKRYKRFYMYHSYSETPWAPDSSKASGWFNWILYTLQFPESQLLVPYGGLDTVIYLRFLKYSAILFSSLTLFGLFVLVPINFKGENLASQISRNGTIEGMNQWTLANIDTGSQFMWAHWLSVVLFSGLAFFLCYLLLDSYMNLKLSTEKQSSTIQTRTVFLNFISLPSVETAEDLKEAFDDIYGKGSVVHAMLISKADELRKMKEKRTKNLKKWKKAKDILYEKEERPIKKKKIGRFPWQTEKVDMIDYYEEKIAKMDEEIVEEQKKDLEMSDKGFVTFDSMEKATMCAQSLHDRSPWKTVPTVAPDPNSINWASINTSAYERRVRKLVVWVLIVLLFMFWAIPVTFISALSNLQTLSSVGGLGSVVEALEESPFLVGIIEGFLPSLALILFMALLPVILTAIVSQKKHTIQSKVIRSVVSYYWLFLLINVFLVTSIAGSLFNVLETIIDRPQSILEMLSESLPSQATFFINYILLATVDVVNQLPRFVPFIISQIKQFVLAKTEREKQEAQISEPYPYRKAGGRTLLIFNIALTYSTMAPLILPFAAIFFSFSYFVCKYNFIFVHPTPFEGLNLPPTFVSRIIVGIFVYELTMLGIFGVKEFYGGAINVVLIAITIVAAVYLYKRFNRSIQHVALPDCGRIPRDVFASEEEEIACIEAMYKDPALKELEPLEWTEVKKDVPNLFESLVNAASLGKGGAIKVAKFGKEGVSNVTKSSVRSIRSLGSKLSRKEESKKDVRVELSNDSDNSLESE